MTRHTLKTHPEHFAAVVAGAKRAELRFDDRGFAVGDELELAEYDPREAAFTGRRLVVRVTHALRGFDGLAPGWVMLSIAP